MRPAFALLGLIVAGCGDNTTITDAAPEAHELLIMNSGGGHALVEAVIPCKGWCRYTRTGTITLTAEPLPGRTFWGWGGDCAGTGDCQLTMDRDRLVWPSFEPPTPVWARSYGGTAGNPQIVTSESGMAAVAFDATGDLVVAGWVAGPAVAEGVSYPGIGGEDIWIVKLSPAGMLRWARRLGGPGQDRALAVAVANDGTIYSTGFFSSTVDFASGPVASAGGHDAFVLALAPDGSTMWSRVFGGSGRDEGRAVLLNPDGSVVVAGSFEATIVVAGPMTSAGGEDAWIAKLDALGNPLWSIRLGGNGGGDGSFYGDVATALTPGSPGTVVVAGYFAATVDFGVSIETAPGGAWDGFVAQIALADGTRRWVRRIGWLGYEQVAAVARLPTGDVVAALTFLLDVPFAGTTHSSRGITDVMIARMDGDTGAETSAFVFGEKEWDAVHGIAFDPRDQSLVVTGFIDRLAQQFGSELLSPYGGGALVAKFALDGTPRWARVYGSFLSQALGVTVQSDGTIAVVGSFEDDLAFGSDFLRGPLGGFVLVVRD